MTSGSARPGAALAAICQTLAMVAALAALAPAARAQALSFPPLTGRVVDDAGILSPATDSELDEMLARMEHANGDQVVVVTLKSLQGHSIEDFGYQLGRFWGIGQKAKSNGVLLIVAPNERKVRIEVGYGLEGELTDAASRVIIERDIVPAFGRGDFDAGVLAGTESILKVLGGDKWVAQSAAHPRAQPGASSQNQMAWVGWVLLGGWGVFFLAIYLVATRHPPRKAYLLRRTGRRSNSSGIPGGFWVGEVGGGGFGSGVSGGGGWFSGGGGSFGGGGASGSW